MRSIAFALAVVVSSSAAGIAVVGCGTSSGVVTSTVTSCHAGAEVVCITRADSGRSVHARLGQAIGLTLSVTDLVWSNPEEVGPRLLRQTAPVARGSTNLTAWYKAVGVGRTSLRATAAPRCTAGQACPQFILLWQVEVIIAR